MRSLSVARVRFQVTRCRMTAAHRWAQLGRATGPGADEELLVVGSVAAMLVTRNEATQIVLGQRTEMEKGQGITCHVAASLAVMALLKAIVLAALLLAEVGRERTLDSFGHCV